jgi:hypothetical protein
LTKNKKLIYKLFKIKNEGPRLMSDQDLMLKGYSNPTQKFYLVFEIDSEAEVEFSAYRWDITKLSGYRPGEFYAVPFGVTLTELMKSKV